MHETPDAFFHLDRPASPDVLTGPVLLQGWAAGKNGRPLVDLRVRLAGALFPAVYGFPRADLAAFFNLREPFLPGGFELTAPLPAGSSELIFEALDIAGHWLRVGTVTLSANGPAPAPAARAPVALQPHEFARALQGTLRAAAHASVETAATELAAALPQPAVLRFPHLPFHGHLHQPTLLERALFGRLRIEGWLFHETAAIRRVAAAVDLQTLQVLEHGGAQAYVAATYPQFPAAKHCRIDGLIDIPAQLPRPVCVRLYAELADGTWHLCQVQRAQIWDQEFEKAPFAPFSRRTFVRAAFALDRAVRARQFDVPRTRDFWRGLRGVYQEYRARAAPPTLPPSTAQPDRPAQSAPALPHRLVLITHNLSHEGAPLFLLELARHLAANGVQLQILSGADGPLAADYVRLGAAVQVIDPGPLQRATTARELRRAIRRLGDECDLTGCDLVVANTLSAYWGVHLAAQAGRPSLFYIHESTTPATFYLGHLAPATLPVIEATFRRATHVSFLTDTTRVYYRPWLGARNHSINPGWIDVPAIDRYLAAHPREELRQALGLDPATRLVINVGSVCDRKGQHIFSRAVDLLWRQAPDLAAASRFLMIGGRDTLFDTDLQRLRASLDRANLRVVPTTVAPLAYYGAADLFVCSSYEESFPRVIMEAMAARVPILSTAVHGVHDLLVDGRDARLVPPGDSQAMAEALQELLRQPERTAALAAPARQRVVTAFSAEILLPRHAALAAATAASTGNAQHRPDHQ